MKSDIRVQIPGAGATGRSVAAKLSHTCAKYAVPTPHSALIIGHARSPASLFERGDPP